MKEFMIVPPSTPSGATTPSEPPYTTTIPLEDQFVMSEERLKEYLASLSLEEQKSLLSFLRAITAKKPSSSTKKKVPDDNQLSFDDIG